LLSYNAALNRYQFGGFCFVLLVVTTAAAGAEIRLGIIGTDTSHAVAFTRALNDSAAANHVAGARVVVAYKGGSPDIEESRSRVDAFASELRDRWGVRFVNAIPEMCGAVDGILLESVDGRQHLPQMKEAVRCGKPVFIDKPLASSLDDAKAIARLAREAHVPWFSASTLRFSEIRSMTQMPVKGAMVWGPGPTEPHQALDLSWYGVHAAEMLYTLLGTGCSVVKRTTSEDADIVTCQWKDGRLGTMRVDRPYSQFGAVVFRAKNRVNVLPEIKVDYIPLVREIVEFMTSSQPPVSNAETLEIFEFLDAAQRSKERGGIPVPMRRE
jgi:Oxidoreductase family, NAD-binding Rossmann fold